MKKKPLIVISLLIIVNSHGQDFEWVKSFGPGTSQGRDITTDNLGNIYTVGYFNGTCDFDPDAGVTNLTSVASSNDIFISKSANDGSLIWVKSVGGSGSDIAQRVIVNSTGEIYITGTFESTVDFDPGAGISNLTSAGSRDIFFLKLDALGNFSWAKRIGGTNQEFPGSLSLRNNGDIIVCGSFQSTVDFDPGAGVSSVTSNGAQDAFILTLSSLGDFISVKAFGGTSNDAIGSAQLDANENLYVCGTYQATVDFDPGPGTQFVTNPSSSYGNPFVLKLNAALDFVWVKVLNQSDGTSAGGAYALSVNSTNEIAVAGLFRGEIDLDPSPGTYLMTSLSPSIMDAFILNLNENGDMIWTGHIHALANNIHIPMIDHDSNDKLFVAGYHTGMEIFDLSNSYNVPTAGQHDIFLIAYDETGLVENYFSLGGTFADNAQSVHIGSLNNIYITGTAGSSIDFDPSPATGMVPTSGGYFARYSQCQPNGSSQTITACDDYFWPTNGATYTASGIYTETLTNMNGCDSVVTLNLTINNSTSGFDIVTACDSYLWIDGNTYTASNFTATHVLTNALGCDSTVYLNLTINNSNSSSETVTACDDYFWPTNGATYTASGIYTETLTNMSGCDSVVTLNLTINNSNSSSQTITACDDYFWPTNGATYTASGTYTETLININGCDSVVTLNLTINFTNSSTENITACDSYTWLANGNSYTASGTYMVVLTNASGCDSTVTLNLTINSVSDVSTTTNGVTISANNNSASYVWLDCNNNQAIIFGENNQSYTATANGSYAVEITENGCVDTSACV
jgi:hypothetical protein